MLSKGESDVRLLFPSLQSHRPEVRPVESSHHRLDSCSLMDGKIANPAARTPGSGERAEAGSCEEGTVCLVPPSPVVHKQACSSLQGLGLGLTHADGMTLLGPQQTHFPGPREAWP